MNKIITAIAMLVSAAAYSQVGIDTEVPKATLDVKGRPSDLTKSDGIIAPRLKGSELKAKDALYTTDQKASLVYVTEALASSDTTAKTINVTSIGYFYFDGSIWQKLNAGNVAVEPWHNAATLQPADSNTQNIYQMGRVGIGITSPRAPLDIRTTAFDVAIMERANSTPSGLSGGPYLAFRRNESDDPLINGAVSDKQALGAITFDGNTGNGYPVTGIRGKASIGAWADEAFTPTSKGAYLDFSTVANGTNEDHVRMRIASNGNVGIGTTTPATKLEVNNGTTNGAIKIVDGTQGVGKVLTSDANGVGTWQTVAASSSNDWSLTGNSGTNAGANFIGTTDAKDFVRKTDNVERERTYKAVNDNNVIKTITGGDLNVNGITVGKGKNNNANNTAVGLQTLFSNTTGGFNTGMGGYALKENTTGNSNVAIGHSSLSKNTTGGSNVAVGASTLVYNTTGTDNIAIGLSALSNISNTNGNFNIGIGFTAGNTLEAGTANNIVIGAKQNLASTTGSNQLNIGGAIFGTGLTGTQNAPAGNIGIGTTTPTTRLEVNNGTTNGAIKIVDGTQGEGKILTSDANGVATWQNGKTKTIMGQNAVGGYDMPFEEFPDYRYTGASITLPPGKWLVLVTQLGRILGSTSVNDWLFVRTTFSDQNLTTIGETGTRSADISAAPTLMSFTISGQSYFNAYSGSVLINNTSGGDKTYRYIAGATETNSPPLSGVTIDGFGGGWAENSITAIAIN